MPVLVIGNKGNMGRRYSAVLKYLGLKTRGLDLDWDFDKLESEVSKVTGVIIATPTETHVGWIRLLAPYNKPILCEKPITKDLNALKLALEYTDNCGTPINMVYQYSELVNPKAKGPTHYNYWNHGRDGMNWDCIQIIGLGKGKISLGEDSPLWKCQINGEHLSSGSMDMAYVEHVRKWLMRPGQDRNQIYDIHKKTSEFKNECELTTL